MAEMLFFVRIDNLNPRTANRDGPPRCLVIRTMADLQPDVLQERLLEAVTAEYQSWKRGWLVQPPPSTRWGRWLANLRALFPSRATAHKLPAAPAVARRRAF